MNRFGAISFDVRGPAVKDALGIPDRLLRRTNMNATVPGSPLTAAQLLDLYYLDLRCHLLEVAAGLDRIDRAADADAARQDRRSVRLRAALDVLAAESPNRAERFLNLFSE